MKNPQQHYQNSIAKGLVSFDETQQQALTELHQLHQQLSSSVNVTKNITKKQDQPPISGLYLWGKVGRGKTFLMDSFVESFPKDVCLRQHFHHFMQNVHNQLTKLSGRKDPLKEIAKQLKSRYKILCFDEFFVTDIGDAMLLGRLIIFLFEQNVVVVATSNCEPSELYKDGLQRANFLPAINAIYKNMHIVELAGSKDHRERVLNTLQNYFVISEGSNDKCDGRDHKQGDEGASNNALIKDVFDRYGLSIKFSGKSDSLEILGRKINYLAINKKTIVFDFKELCLGPRSHFDYIELAQQFNTLILINVPALGGEMFERIKARGTEDGSVGSGDTGERQVMLAPMDDGARRFIALIDELYDQQVVLYLTCEVPLKELYTRGSLNFQFERARSRLIEMGSKEYMAQSRSEC
jgi:cell division protein ZapE